jgi:hypothetical protein
LSGELWVGFLSTYPVGLILERASWKLEGAWWKLECA